MRMMMCLAFVSALGCGQPIEIDNDPIPAPLAPVDPSPVDDDDDEPPPPVEEEEPAPLAMTVRFREPGQHVVLNTQAGNTTGELYLVTLPSEDVEPTPFVLQDAAVEGALSASARLSVEPEANKIVVRASATASVDSVAYAVGQAGPLPIEVCATVNDGSLIVQLSLTCEVEMKVEGFGITAITATNDGEAYCNGVNLNGDTTLIPFTSPTTAVNNVEVRADGKACWPIDLYIGANSDDDGAGVSEANGSFTFTASLP